MADDPDYIDDDKIAILGMSCRFPGARDIAEYRHLLRTGKSVFTPVAQEDAVKNGVPIEQLEKKDFVRSSAPFEDLFRYDIALANLNKDSARKIDPQFYHLWECIWEALENANCGFNQRDVRIGIFSGSDTSWYAHQHMQSTQLWDPMEDWDSFLLNDSHFISTWISYKYGFKGPSIGVQTACSTSLTAVHLACNALIAGDCDIAVAGGVSIRGPQQTGYLYRTGGILSPSGICRPFDIKSDGTVLASGVGVVVLSRYEVAAQKKLPILATIISSVVNNDGNEKVAFTAPNGPAQVSLIKEAIEISGVSLDSIEYIETHGTGTELGDAVEVQSLSQVFHSISSGKIFIGSCKANFGHLESAAGIAGLIKSVLSVANNEIYPLPNFTEPNPKLQIKTPPLAIPRELKTYGNKEFRRAGISSFGIGGTNAHVLVESVNIANSHKNGDCYFWPVFGISAMSLEAGDRLYNRLLKQISDDPDSVALAGATIITHRSPLTYRKAMPFPPGSNAGVLPTLSDIEFVKTTPKSTGLTLTFDHLLVPNLLEILSHANSRLKAIIEAYTILAKNLGLEILNVGKNKGPWVQSVIAIFSITEWIVSLGLSIRKVEGFLSESLSDCLCSGESLPKCFERVCLQDSESHKLNKSINSDCDRLFVINDTRLSLSLTEDIGYQLANLFCRLWTDGYDIDWTHYFPSFEPIRLPAYPFDRISIQPTQNEIKTIHLRQYLTGLWEEMLDGSPEQYDHFFDAGGDSLSAMKFTSRINNDLEAGILIEDIYESPTFEDILNLLEAKTIKEKSRNFPLSSNQAALYSLCSLMQKSPVYNVYACFELKGPLDIDILYRSFEAALHHQDVFRTAFVWDHTNIIQHVSDCPAFSWKFLPDIPEESNARREINQHIRTIFDLTSPPLFSVLLIKRQSDLFNLSVVSHHLVSDEWSAQMIVKQVILAYDHICRNQTPLIPAVKRSYGEYAIQDKENFKSQSSLNRLHFWQTYLKGVSSFEYKQPSIGQAEETFEGSLVYFDLPASIYTGVKHLARQLKTTPFVVLLSTFNILLHRYTSQSDICIGINLANRNDIEFEHLAGYFTNTLPIRTGIEPSDTFKTVVCKCHKSALDVQQNQLPLSQIRDLFPDIEKNTGRAFFDTIFVFQNVPRNHEAFKDISFKKLHHHNGTAKFNLEFILEPDTADGLSGMVEFKTNKFDKQTITSIIRHFKSLLQDGVAAPEKPISQLELISPDELRKVLHDFNSLRQDHYRTEPDFWQLFEQCAVAAPDAPAIIRADNKTLSYEELSGLSRALGNRLLAAKKTGQQDCVAILCKRSEETAIALLAVQACGRAFLLLDPNLPDHRLSDIIHDCGPETIIVSKDNVKRAEKIAERCPKKLVLLESLSPAGAIERPASQSQLAYIMYTSGSTGKPKGAMITRPGMMNHLHEKIRTVEIKAGSRVAQTASLSFDISIWQFLAPLMCGATLVLFSDDQIFDIDLYLKRIEDQHCDVVELVPSYLETVLQALELTPHQLGTLKYLMSTGEALPSALCNRWLSIYPRIAIINAYGPTECADDVLQQVINKFHPEHNLIPAGIPLANLQIYILDPAMQPVPPEVIGEIYVGGIGVGLGYLNNPQKTRECFLPNPFSHNKDVATIYKTGDWGAWKHDGSVVYLGRIDSQIKINGARVELAEVDTILNQCPLVKQSVSVYEPSQNTIAAFCIPQETHLDVQAVRLYSQSHLPSFMCPSMFKPLDRIPRNNSGKVDREKLRQLLAKTGPDFPTIIPLTEKETQLKEVWQHILGTNTITKMSNFFDLGGNSLGAIRLVAMARKYHLALSPKDVFRHPVLWDMADQCNNQPESNALDHKSLSDGEQQFFDINANQFKTLDSAFLVELTPNIDAHIVQDAVAYVWEQYPGLRTRYAKATDNRWRKSLHPPETVPFTMIILSSDIDPAQLNLIVSGFRELLFSQQAPLFDTTLIQHGEKKLLLVRGHYLVCDFVSWQILLDEFMIFLKTKVVFNTKSLNNRNHQICSLPNHLTSNTDWDKNIEALLTIALDEMLAAHFKPSEYYILIGHNARDDGNITDDMIGRYSAIRQLPELNLVGAPHLRLEKAKQTIAAANNYKPIRENRRWLVNLDYFGTTDIRNRPGITGLSRGYLSGRSHQLFPIELIAWTHQDTLFVEIIIDQNKAPIETGTMQDQLSEILARLVGLLEIKENHHDISK